MSCKEVVTFWLDMGAPISLLSRFFGATAPEKRHTPRQVAAPACPGRLAAAEFDPFCVSWPSLCSKAIQRGQ